MSRVRHTLSDRSNMRRASTNAKATSLGEVSHVGRRRRVGVRQHGLGVGGVAPARKRAVLEDVKLVHAGADFGGGCSEGVVGGIAHEVLTEDLLREGVYRHVRPRSRNGDETVLRADEYRMGRCRRRLSKWAMGMWQRSTKTSMRSSSMTLSAC